MKQRLYRREMWLGYLFVLPIALQFLIFTLGPMVFSAYMSFTDWNMLQSANVVGFDNFASLLKDTQFWKAVYNTVFYMIGIPIGLILSMTLAVLLNQRVPGDRAFRVMIYAPAVASIAAVSILWQYLLNTDFGLINYILGWFGIDGPNWLGNENWVKPALIMINVWKGLGVSTIFYLAGLQNISHDLYESAEIDGASSLRKLIHITMPLLTPMTFFLIVTGLIGGFQLFVEVAVITPNGGPNYSSASIVFYLWQKAFVYNEMGFASAVAWFLGIVIFIVTFIQFKMQKHWVHQQ